MSYYINLCICIPSCINICINYIYYGTSTVADEEEKDAATEVEVALEEEKPIAEHADADDAAPVAAGMRH